MEDIENATLVSEFNKQFKISGDSAEVKKIEKINAQTTENTKQFMSVDNRILLATNTSADKGKCIINAEYLVKAVKVLRILDKKAKVKIRFYDDNYPCVISTDRHLIVVAPLVEE